MATGFSKKLIITGIILAGFVLNSFDVKGYAGVSADKLRPSAEAEDKEIKDDFEKMAAHLKQNLGANAVLGISAVFVRQAAEAKGLPLYQFIAQNLGNRVGREKFTLEDYLKAVRAVNPLMNVMNGGAHGNWVTDIQEWMLAVGFGRDLPFSQRMEMANKVVAALTEIFKSPKELTRILGRQINEPFPVSVGDEGGYTPILKGNEEALKLLTAAIEKAGLTGKVRIAIDAAITELYDEQTQRYILKTDGRSLNTTEWADQLEKWIKDYDIVSTEDIFAESHWEGWKEGFRRFGNKVLIIGDDLTVTNIELLKKAINEEAINSILIKINQNGSISGTLEVIQYALLNGINVAISHRSGETEDTFISHLVVAANLFEKKPNPKTGKMPMVLLKTGGFKRSDRIAKYNEILRIEADLERRIQGLAPAVNQPGLSPKTIIDVYALEIYDSRGNPTVESVITLNDGTVMRNAVPSGASTGSRESIELRDGVIAKNSPERITKDFISKMFPGKTVDEVRSILAGRVGGKGVKLAVYNVNFLIAPLIIADKADMSRMDSLPGLAELDNIMLGLELKLAKIPGYLQYTQAEDTVYSVSGGGALDNLVKGISEKAREILKTPKLKISLEEKSDSVAQITWKFSGITARKNFNFTNIEELNKLIAIFQENNLDLKKKADYDKAIELTAAALEKITISKPTFDFVKYTLLPKIATELSNSKKIQRIEEEPRVFLVTPNVFKGGGIRNALRKAAELNGVVNIKVAFYGDKTPELNDILEIEKENIVTAKNLDGLLKELENRNIGPGNTIALITPEDKDDSAKLKEAGIRQIVVPEITTLAVAKGIKELFSDFDFVRQGFNEFMSRILIEDKVIDPINRDAHAEIIEGLKEGVFVFPEQVKLNPEVAKVIKEAIDTEVYKKFVEKFI